MSKIFIHVSCLIIKLHFKKYENCDRSKELNFTKPNALNNSFCKTKISCSTSRLKQIMQQILLLPSCCEKDYFKSLGDKVHVCGIQCSHHCFMAILDGSPQNPLNGGKSWPCLSLSSYVFIVATTLWFTGAGDEERRKTWLSPLYLTKFHVCFY